MSDTNKKAKELSKQAMELAREYYYALVRGDDSNAGRIEVEIDLLDKKGTALIGEHKSALMEAKLEEAKNNYGCSDNHFQQIVNSEGFSNYAQSEILRCIGVSEALGMAIIDEMIA
jgi:uncharacterized protein GlcG (DUF336 family)